MLGAMSYDDAYRALERALKEAGFAPELAETLALGLNSEMTLSRMAAYVRQARPTTVEELADEMYAILEQRNSWVERKKNAYYNEKLNEFYNRERTEDASDDEL